MHPKPSTLGVNAPYRAPKKLGLFRARAQLAHVVGLLVPTSSQARSHCLFTKVILGVLESTSLAHLSTRHCFYRFHDWYSNLSK